MKRFAYALSTIAQEIQKLKLARSATFKKMKETVKALYDKKQQQDAAARLEKDFYYTNLELLHKMIIMMPAKSGLLFGILYYTRIENTHVLRFKKISYGHLYSAQFHTRSKLLSLIAIEEPQYQVVAEDDTGRMI